MPDYVLRPKLHGAGMIEVFQIFRPLVPEFEDEILFRGFLVAFGRHVRLTLQRDFDCGLVTHWWNGQIKGSDCMFLDSSRGGGRAVFNEGGRLKLAFYLAEQTFVSLEQYFAAGIHAQFLESAAVVVERDYLNKHREEIQMGSLEEELLTVPKLAPKFTLPKALMEAKRGKDSSITQLAKRSPEIQGVAPNRPITNTERMALRWNHMTEEEKQARRDKEAARKKELRHQKKVSFYKVDIKMGRRRHEPMSSAWKTDTWVLVSILPPLFSLVS